ncbi:NAD(P)-dependent dehydrogenase (short-subunit alcohol dehydrogenase family) [Psychrobacter sp. PL15]|jgi:NAD(P)-dependent dehydrogenase (short-subunit alcohol dehydrogenase family)|uniref:SDR family oxidoreductase n=1 Tax=unclassified Psychrobacter TaxID=196806 RepID=UPI001AE1C911|nr:SDR family oxidoreductase [Psychrobacter sp. PL15]MEC5211176.1 NAD(P)-dependent dehydrogenase (short-subunit alcohol dehydrogenase family) [Psychrobacter sp. PL15]
MSNKTYLIIGGTGGIGQAMVKQLVNSTSNQVFATYHRSVPDFEADNLHWLKMDVSDEDSIKQAADVIKQQSPHIDWVINCVGLLHTEHSQPEKALRQVETDFFLYNMQVNALAGLLIAKHLKPLLTKAERDADKPAIFATISARVGSISDNQMGGWYSYRMSKTALNMGMKNLSIEWGRSLKNVCVVVMQPGTVNTQLSAPFQSNVADGHLFSPAYSAECLLEVLASMTADQSGSFVDWSGESIPW